MDYKEKLRLAKEALDSGSYDKETIEYIFPELKESEDERIRNFISNELACLRATDEKGSDRYEELTKAIDWLEKQGEHKKFRDSIQVGDKVTRNEDGVLINLSQLNRVAKKQGEQKPAEWSEEDEKQARQIERIVRDDGCTQKLQKQIADWFKSLKDRVQPKQEWSEWDRILQDSSISYLCNLRDSFETKGWDKEPVQKCINWLISFRPQNHWKPSEEQIAVINDTIRFIEDKSDSLSSDYLYNKMKELLEQLKAL